LTLLRNLDVKFHEERFVPLPSHFPSLAKIRDFFGLPVDVLPDEWLLVFPSIIES
jgi:hypothetical protein